MSKGRVLVVDDEADVRKSVRLILTKAGYDVDEAEHPEAGATLVIPYLHSQFPSCPIIVLSGSKMLERSTKLFKDAGVHFLAKPINQEQLLSAVSKAVNKGG